MKHEQAKTKKKTGAAKPATDFAFAAVWSACAHSDPACARCSGLIRYPHPSLCDWCGQVHAGDSNNCPESVTRGDDFSNDGDPGVELVCQDVENSIRAITRKIGQEGVKRMPSASQALANRGGGAGGQLLKGSDVPKAQNSVRVKIAKVRQSPNEFNAPFIVDFEKEVHNAVGWAVNKTNTKLLIELFGDNTDKWEGKTITLNIVNVQNPSTGKPTRSLQVAA